jgi:hypothetical protein
VDKLTGDLLIGDVGQNKVEEIDFQKSGDEGGENYGWSIVEGDSCYNPSSGCDKTGITMPVYEYFHNGSSAAVTGGYVYRSAQSKALWGQYIFSDYVFKWIEAFRLENGVVSGNVNQLISAAEATGNPISFGEDKYGDQYILFNGDGTVYKLEDTSYLRRPKAYFTQEDQGGGSYVLHAWQGRNLSYQWLRNNSEIPGATSPDYSTSTDGSYTLKVTNDLSFSDTSDVFVLGALPLNLVSFTAQKKPGGYTALQWQTASEQNVQGFTVLRRKNNETSFMPVGYVESQTKNGNTGNGANYVFNDSIAFTNGAIYYRLKIINIDGTFSYSGIRMVNSATAGFDYSIYPNPAKKQVTVFINNYNKPVLMKMFNAAGQLVKEQLLDQQSTLVNLPGLQGIYIIKFKDKEGNSLAQEKLLVQ